MVNVQHAIRNSRLISVDDGGLPLDVSVWTHVFAAGSESLSFTDILLECLLFTGNVRGYRWPGTVFGLDFYLHVTYRNIDNFKIKIDASVGAARALEARALGLISFVGWFESQRHINFI